MKDEHFDMARTRNCSMWLGRGNEVARTSPLLELPCNGKDISYDPWNFINYYLIKIRNKIQYTVCFVKQETLSLVNQSTLGFISFAFSKSRQILQCFIFLPKLKPIRHGHVFGLNIYYYPENDAYMSDKTERRIFLR